MTNYSAAPQNFPKSEKLYIPVTGLRVFLSCPNFFFSVQIHNWNLKNVFFVGKISGLQKDILF